MKALGAILTVALIAAASSQRVNVRSRRELKLVFDGGGSCVSQMDINTVHCTISTLLDQVELTHAYTYEVPCSEDFESCGEDFRCDCTDVWRDAGMLWPDGGRCEAFWVRFRDGGGNVVDGCRGAREPELQPNHLSDFPIRPPLSKPQ